LCPERVQRIKVCVGRNLLSIRKVITKNCIRGNKKDKIGNREGSNGQTRRKECDKGSRDRWGTLFGGRQIILECHLEWEGNRGGPRDRTGGSGNASQAVGWGISRWAVISKVQSVWNMIKKRTPERKLHQKKSKNMGKKFTPDLGGNRNFGGRKPIQSVLHSTLETTANQPWRWWGGGRGEIGPTEPSPTRGGRKKTHVEGRKACSRPKQSNAKGRESLRYKKRKGTG